MGPTHVLPTRHTAGKTQRHPMEQLCVVYAKTHTLCREQYPEIVSTILGHIREGEPLPSLKTIVENIEQQLPELILRTYINRFPITP